jgi:hypothetical protein
VKGRIAGINFRYLELGEDDVNIVSVCFDSHFVEFDADDLSPVARPSRARDNLRTRVQGLILDTPNVALEIATTLKANEPVVERDLMWPA